MFWKVSTSALQLLGIMLLCVFESVFILPLVTLTFFAFSLANEKNNVLHGILVLTLVVSLATTLQLDWLKTAFFVSGFTVLIAGLRRYLSERNQYLRAVVSAVIAGAALALFWPELELSHQLLQTTVVAGILGMLALRLDMRAAQKKTHNWLSLQ